MEIRNLKEAKELVKKYQSLTIADLINAEDEDDFSGQVVMNKLTGFGTVQSCTMCVERNSTVYCERHCLFSIQVESKEGNKVYPCVTNSYLKVAYAESPEELESALRTFTEYIQELIKITEADSIQKKAAKRLPSKAQILADGFAEVKPLKQLIKEKVVNIGNRKFTDISDMYFPLPMDSLCGKTLNVFTKHGKYEDTSKPDCITLSNEDGSDFWSWPLTAIKR